MRKKLRAGVSIVASLALASSLLALPTSAYASSSISNNVGESTNWTAPSEYMDNTVEVDGTLYKVITTWANAWALSGPDYLGISNSGALNQSGGGSGSTDLTTSSTTTMLGIWASAVNEVPNAYNWNFFYNMALDDAGEDADSSQVTVINVANSSKPGYDSQSGVWAAFKYRPEIIWSSNSLSESEAATAVAEINSLSYYTSSSSTTVGNHDVTTTDDDGNSTTTTEEADATGTDNDYYVDGDESYDPYIMTADRSSSLTKLASLYELAGYAEAVVEDTADYNSDGSVTSDNVTWKTMNSLPRTTRYEASTENAVSATECALDLEKLLKGSVYYTLSQIEAGTVEKKTVAWVYGTIDTTGSTAPVASFGGEVEGGTGYVAGKAGVAALTVDPLTTDTTYSVTSTGRDGTETTTEYDDIFVATADELLSADIIWAANGSLSVEDIKTWLTNNATTDEAKAKIDTIEILTDLPALMNGHNHTTEKSICDIYDISFFYPELWPDLELVTYWYDNIYHITKSSLNLCMTYGLGNCTMPSGTELTDLGGSSYDSSDIDAKAKAGYEYWASNLNVEDSIYVSKIGYTVDNEFVADSEGTEQNAYAPTSTYVEWATAVVEEEDGDGTEDTTTLTFTDLDGSEYWYDAVYAMVDLGILTGYTSTYVTDEDGNITAEYGDTDAVKRADFAVILWRMACPEEYAAYNNDAANETTFADNTANTYYTAAVNWAVENGIVTGYSSTKFAPTKSITFQEACLMLARYISGEANPTAADSATTLAAFSDASSISSWAAEGVAYCIEQGAVNGTSQGTIVPKASISRGRTAQLMYQAYTSGVISVG